MLTPYGLIGKLTSAPRMQTDKSGRCACRQLRTEVTGKNVAIFGL